jgi:hypothetical protein
MGRLSGGTRCKIGHYTDLVTDYSYSLKFIYE